MSEITQAEKTSLRERLQFAIVLTLFFPVVFSSALKSGSPEADKFTIEWGLPIVILVTNYFLVEGLKIVSWKWVISFANLLIFTLIGMFAVVMYGLAAAQTFNGVPIWGAVAIGVALLGLVVMPFILLGVLGINFLYPIAKETVQDSKAISRMLRRKIK